MASTGISVLKLSILVLLLAPSIALTINALEPKLIGTKPEKQQVVKLNKLTAIEQAVKEDNNSIESLRKAVDQLKILLKEDQSEAVVFGLVYYLSEIIKQDPKASDALLDLADISFEKQIFDQSSAYYLRYLEIYPDDHAVRSRYASSLGFEGKHPQSLAELEKILKEQPQNFQALAFKSITYFQMNDLAKAKEVGKEALKYAPNEEARNRLSLFLDKSLEPQSLDPIESKLKANPVAGPKFVRYLIAAESIEIEYKDFPMEHMPEFARNKFVSDLKGIFKDSKVKEVKIIDSATRNIMYSFNLDK